MPAELGVPPIETPPAKVPSRWKSPNWKPRRVIPPGEAGMEALRLLRVALRNAIGPRTIDQVAGLADCSTNTIMRILRGDNATVATAARIISRLGGGQL